MKGTTTMGLCVVTMFLLSAIVGVSAAQAGEYGQCKGKDPASGRAITRGDFTDANCLSLSVGSRGEQDKGHFEWYPGPSPNCERQNRGEYTNSSCTVKSRRPHRGRYENPCANPVGGPLIDCAGYESLSGQAHLAITGAPTVECKNSKDLGKITGPKSDVDSITFTGCELSGFGLKCTGALQPAGSIATYLLETTLIDNGETGLGGLQPSPSEVWLELSNLTLSNNPNLAEFECEPGGATDVRFRLYGSASGVYNSANAMSVSSKQDFGAGKGEQDIVAEYCVNEALGGPNCKNAKATFEMLNVATKGNEPFEVRTLSFPTT
jgi:hypothetical protein